MTPLEALASSLKFAEASCGLRPVVQARYEGIQRVPEYAFELELWTLEESIPGHPKGSTVSRTTLERAGYALPNRRSSDGSE